MADAAVSPPEHPTWDDTVSFLFSAPYWIDEARRAQVAAGWRQCMVGYDIDLAEYVSVRQWSVTIYDHLASRAMPLSTDTTQFWPDPALALLRTWVNQGCRKGSGDPLVRRTVIPDPTPTPRRLRVRRDIFDLTVDELNEYRAKLERLQITNPDPSSPWQQLAYIHTNWCLHYQEAFLLWHRANLLYFEDALDFAIPYWDFMAPEVTRDSSPRTGLPQPFKDLTYAHPDTGEERPNPLRFAMAKDGRSKACTADAQVDAVDGTPCQYVHRDPVLYTTGDDHRKQRLEKLQLVETFQAQVDWALRWPVFSSPEGAPGYPWANIQTFNPPPPDSDYPHRCDFDGLYEQPHDNFHGWVGPDMADNAYTAFDPVFWSYHANIDRIFEQWKRAHPAATFTANFAIRPFVGADAGRVDMTDPVELDYTTIGDMARDSRALGYDYGPPISRPAAHGDASVAAAAATPLYVVFGGVRCIRDTFTIDVFVNLPGARPEDVHNENRDHYAGRLTRLGMGIDDDKGRCRSAGVTRVLDASRTASALGLAPGSAVDLNLVVTDVTAGKLLRPDEFAGLAGFRPEPRWGNHATSDTASGPGPSSGAAAGSCH